MASEKARKAAARKRATVRAQERTRRTIRTPGKMAEQGVGLGNLARGIARIVGSTARASGKAGRPAANAGSRAAKQAAKKTTKKAAPAEKRTPGRRTAQTPQWAKSYGTKKPSQVKIRMTKKDVERTKRVQQKLKTAGSKKRANVARNATVGVAGGVGAAGVAGAAATQYKNRRPKGRMPVRPKKK